jgi:uncharacterized membrane protein
MERDDDEDGQADPSDPPGHDAALEKLPAPLREALSQPGVPPQLLSMTLAAFTASYAGPLPPADQIRAYEEVLPGSADRILAMAERQQEHRHELERVTINEAANRSWWGLRLGFVIALTVIGVGAGAIFTGHALAGFALIVAQAAVLAGVFVVGRVEQRKERVEKSALTQLPPGQVRPPDNSQA